MSMLTEVIEPFAEVALTNITRPYPYADHHLVFGPEGHQPAVIAHPAFANSFDWHSSVHMHYLLVQLLDHGLSGELREQAISTLTEHLSGEHMGVEAAFLRENPSWERPYGWAWAVELAQATRTSHIPAIAALAEACQQLADAVFELTLAWLSRLPEPVRHGLHTNTAFGLQRIRKVAQLQSRRDVIAAIDGAARQFFMPDGAWNFEQERSGQDFLSPGLCEADLMIDVLSDDELASWLPVYLSQLRADSRILAPATVLDPTDGYQSHLYGLGLTIAAALLRIAPRLSAIAQAKDDTALLQQAEDLLTRIPALIGPGLKAARSDEYVSSHWIATFAWEALVQQSQSPE